MCSLFYFVYFHGADIDTSKGRRVRDEISHLSTSDLVVSGSRGIGGIIPDKSNAIDLFDLEEDDDDDDDDEESSEE